MYVTMLSGSQTAFGITTPAGSALATGMEPAGAIEVCFFACAFSGVYVQGQGFSLTLASIAAAIAAVKRDNGTITVLSVAAAAPAREGTINPAFVMPVNLSAITLGSSTTVTGLLYGPDLATEHAAVALLGFTAPATFACVYLDQAAL